MKKVSCIVVMAVLAVAVLVLSVISFTSLGVALRYERTAPVDMRAFDRILTASEAVLNSDTGFSEVNFRPGSGASAESTSSCLRGQLQHVNDARTYTPVDPEKTDVMAALLELVRAVDERARSEAYTLSLHGLQSRVFGEEGRYGPNIAWKVSCQSLNGREFSSEGVSFPGSRRYVYLDLDYMSVVNPACRFRWTVLCDRQEKTLDVLINCYIVSPVYVGPATPDPGSSLLIEPTSKP